MTLIVWYTGDTVMCIYYYIVLLTDKNNNNTKTKTKMIFYISIPREYISTFYYNFCFLIDIRYKLKTRGHHIIDHIVDIFVQYQEIDNILKYKTTNREHVTRNW